MKTIITTSTLLVVFTSILSANAFAAKPNTYSCSGYILVIKNDESMSLTNCSQNSSAYPLQLDGPSSGTSTTTLASGSLIPLKMNVLDHIQVSIDNTVIEGASEGNISVDTSTNGSAKKTFSCSKL